MSNYNNNPGNVPPNQGFPGNQQQFGGMYGQHGNFSQNTHQGSPGMNPGLAGGNKMSPAPNSPYQQSMQTGPGNNVGSSPGMYGASAGYGQQPQHSQQPMQTSNIQSQMIQSPAPTPATAAPTPPATTAASNPNPVGEAQPSAQTQPPAHSQQQSKEPNAASLCRFGQEAVQEIVARAQDVFQTLKVIQPSDGKPTPGGDRKLKLQETLKNIRALFKRLRIIYEKTEEGCPSSEDCYFEDSLPFKDAPDNSILDVNKNTEAYLHASEEYREIMEVLMIRNRHLRETMDHLRQTIWDINTMLAMRRE